MVICGIKEGESESYVDLSETSVVRSWSNGRGIGGIAKAEYKDEYTLDEIGDVRINKDKILFEIPREW